MFGAPVYLAEAPDILGNHERLTQLDQRQQALDQQGANQQSQAQSRATLSGEAQQRALTNRLGALIQLSGDNPEMATQFLDGDTELQRMFNVKPGQFKFEGKRGKDIVIRDLHGGKTWLADTSEKDPAKAFRAGPPITPPPRGAGGSGGRSATKADLAQRAIGGDEEAAQILAETGGLTALKSSLARHAAGAGVTDPYVKGLSRGEAKRQFEELAKLDPFANMMRDAVSRGGGVAGGPDEVDGGAVGGGGPAPGGTVRVRNSETGEEFEGPPGVDIPDGFEEVR